MLAPGGGGMELPGMAGDVRGAPALAGGGGGGAGGIPGGGGGGPQTQAARRGGGGGAGAPGGGGGGTGAGVGNPFTDSYGMNGDFSSTATAAASMQHSGGMLGPMVRREWADDPTRIAGTNFMVASARSRLQYALTG
jgi:hypothetical protein